MKEIPLVSVVMACYNDSRFLRESIESILNQTVKDFEFIIIDDCSTDNSVAIIKSYNDNRIILVRNEENKGLGYNLNLGVTMARGKYIARMDADDISMPNRFEMQVKYLDAHPDVLCLGTSAKKIGKINWRTRLFSRYMKQTSDYNKIKVYCLFGTPMLHPSVMFNGEKIRANNINYNPNVRRAQDYELWSRIVWNYKFSNLPAYLLYYRYSESQASKSGRNEQICKSQNIYKIILSKILGRDVNEDEILAHVLFSTKARQNQRELEISFYWANTILSTIQDDQYIDRAFLHTLIAKRWAVIIRESIPFFQRFKYYAMVKGATKHFISNVLRLYSKFRLS